MFARVWITQVNHCNQNEGVKYMLHEHMNVSECFEHVPNTHGFGAQGSGAEKYYI